MFATISSRWLFAVIFLLSIVVYSAATSWVGTALWGDALYYYSYTRSAGVDGDINFANEAFHSEYGFPNDPFVVEKTGRVGNKFSFGAPLLWLPFFLIGQAVSFVGQHLGFSVSLDGYSKITQMAVGYATVGFSVAGIVVVRQALARIYSIKTATYAVLAFASATPLAYYTAVDPFNSHSAAFLLSAILLWQTTRMFFSQKLLYDWKQFVALGAIVGLQGLVRNQDMLFLAPVLLGICWMYLREGKVWSFCKHASLSVLTLMVLMSTQLFVTLYIFGELGSPYAIGGEVFSWLSPDFARIFFSFENGLFFFAPLTAISLLGVLFSDKKTENSVLAYVSVMAFLLQAYVVAIWAPEIIGGPYGSRMFVSSLPWLAVLGAAVVERVQKEHVRVRFLSLLFLAWCCCNMLVQTIMMLRYW